MLRPRQRVIGIHVLTYRACLIDGCLIGSWLILNTTLILRDRLVYRGSLNSFSASEDATDIR